MKRKCIYEALVTDRVDFGGKAKVRVELPDVPEDDGSLVSVKNVIPGQKIRFRLKKKGAGDFVELLKKSPFETEDECELFRICGGCVYQSVDYRKQLEIKESGVKRLIEAVYDDEENVPVFDDIIASPFKERYRNKMEYSFGDAFKDGPMTLGLHKRGSRFDVLTTDACHLVHEDFNRVVRFTLDFFDKEGIGYYHKMEGTGLLRHLVLRRSEYSGDVLVTLVTASGKGQETGGISEDVLERFTKGLCNLELDGQAAGILHTVNDSPADVVKDEGTTLLYGVNYITEKILGLDFKITPFSFFQTNSKGAELLYAKAREYALTGGVNETSEPTSDTGPVIFDLYSGTGTIAQIMAPVAKKVIGVEIVEEAVEAAKENAKLNGLDNCEFIADDVLKALDEIKERPDFIILDPPRDGVHPKALEKILDYGVENILYISCKPTSLARDLQVCRSAGYEVERICCVDMFPGTGHVETVVKLSQKHIDHSIRVELDLDEFDETPTELRKKATYKEIKQYILDTHGKKVSTLYISQIKRKCGLEVGKCYNKPKSERVPAPVCPPDKEELIMDALRHFKLID